MKVTISFHASVEIEVDDKYTVLDKEDYYNDEEQELVYELERITKEKVKKKINNPAIDVYNFHYCEASKTHNCIWDY